VNLTALEIYLEETDQWHGKPLYAEIVELARKEGMSGATVFRGVMGFGASTKMHSMHVLDIAEDLPVVIKIIDEAAKISRFALRVREMAPKRKIVTWQVEGIS